MNIAVSQVFGGAVPQKSLSTSQRKRKVESPFFATNFAPVHTDIVGVVGSKGLFWDQEFITAPTCDDVPRPNRLSIKSSALKRQANSDSLWAMDELSKWNKRLPSPNMIASAPSLQTSKGVSRYWPSLNYVSSLSRDDLSRLQVVGQVDGKFIACILKRYCLFSTHDLVNRPKSLVLD